MHDNFITDITCSHKYKPVNTLTFTHRNHYKRIHWKEYEFVEKHVVQTRSQGSSLDAEEPPSQIKGPQFYQKDLLFC